jgi:hypothetical protein
MCGDGGEVLAGGGVEEHRELGDAVACDGEDVHGVGVPSFVGEEPQHCGSALVPGGQRRHLQGDVSAHETGQGGDVGLLERGDVLIEQFPALPVGGLRDT